MCTRITIYERRKNINLAVHPRAPEGRWTAYAVRVCDGSVGRTWLSLKCYSECQKAQADGSTKFASPFFDVIVVEQWKSFLIDLESEPLTPLDSIVPAIKHQNINPNSSEMYTPETTRRGQR